MYVLRDDVLHINKYQRTRARQRYIIILLQYGTFRLVLVKSNLFWGNSDKFRSTSRRRKMKMIKSNTSF